MSTRHKTTRLLHRSTALQLAVILAFWLGGTALSGLLAAPIPGALFGLAALLWLLATRRLSPLSVQRGAGWLLAEMLLFFVPAVLGVLGHHELLGLTGLKILFVILASTAAVMLVTALSVEFCQRLRRRRGWAPQAR